MKKSIIYIGIILAILSILSCKKEYKKTETGLQYLFYKSNNSTKPKEGDLMYCNLIFKKIKNGEDSVFFTSIQADTGTIYTADKPACVGCIEEGFMMMSEGDSATFIASADSFFLNTNKQDLPGYFNKGEMIKFEVKMIRIVTQEQIKAQKEELKYREERTLAEYLKRKKISVPPTVSGLYFWKDERGGNGCSAMAEDGDMVEIRYVTQLLNEKVYELHPGLSILDEEGYGMEEIIIFKIGKNLVIPGLEEAVKKMRCGTEAYLIIPSKLAYDEETGSVNLIMPNKASSLSSSWANLEPEVVPPSTSILVNLQLHEIIDKNTNMIKEPCY